jgi:cell division protein FtsZ
MRDGGTATTGIGWASGPGRAVEAAHAAVNNPLLDHDISGAGAILLNVAGASTMSMREVTRAADEIRNVADPEASIIFGTIFDDHLGDELRVTVIATRFSDRTLERPAAAVAAPVVAEPEAPVVPEPVTPEPAEPEPVTPPVLEEQRPIAAAAAIAPIASWQEPAIEPELTPEPEAVADADEPEPAAKPVGFHVAPDDEPEPVTPWYASSAPAQPQTSDAHRASEQPMSSSVATVLAALAEEPPAPAYEPYEQPSASYEAPSASVEQEAAPTPTYYEQEAQPETPEPAEEAPALPQGLAEILRDEPEPVATELPEPEPSAPSAPAPAPVAPRTTTPAQPGPQRHEAVRTPTSALVGRFWSRIGKSQR